MTSCFFCFHSLYSSLDQPIGDLVSKETVCCVGEKVKHLNRFPYERRNAAAALQQFTFMVAQRLSVFKAVLVSRSSREPHISCTAKTLQNFATVKKR